MNAARLARSLVEDGVEPKLAQSLAEHLAEWDEALPLERRLMHVASTLACYGSVRAGRRLKAEEMNIAAANVDRLGPRCWCPDRVCAGNA